MDIDLTKTIGLGLTTAVIGTFTALQRSWRHNQYPIQYRKLVLNADHAPSSTGAPGDVIKPEDPILATPVKAPLRVQFAEKEEIRHISQIHDEVSSDSSSRPDDLVNDDPGSPENVQQVTHQEENTSSSLSESSSDSSDSTESDIDRELYAALQAENSELRRQLDSMEENHRHELLQVQTVTSPGGTRHDAHSVLNEVLRLRSDLRDAQHHNGLAYQDNLRLQQSVHEEQRRWQHIAHCLCPSDDSVSVSRAEEVVRELRMDSSRVRDLEQRCAELEAAAIEQTSRALDLREQLSATRLSKVQELTELRKRLATEEEAHRSREQSLLLKIDELEGRLLQSLRASPPRPEIVDRWENVEKHDVSASSRFSSVQQFDVPYRSPSSSSFLRRQRQEVERQEREPTGKFETGSRRLLQDSPQPVVLHSTLMHPISAGKGSGKRSTSTPSSQRRVSGSGGLTTPPPAHTPSRKTVSTEQFLRSLGNESPTLF